MMSAPLPGWRAVKVTGSRTRRDRAGVIRELAGVTFPGKRIVPVMDNLNVRTAGSLCGTFPPAGAAGIAARLEIRCAPKHGSRLNVAETGIGAMARQRLNRRIPGRAAMRRETGAWAERRNREKAAVSWRFTTADARVRLKSLYPSTQ